MRFYNVHNDLCEFTKRKNSIMWEGTWLTAKSNKYKIGERFIEFTDTFWEKIDRGECSLIPTESVIINGLEPYPVEDEIAEPEMIII